jgi:hypothetical protein
MNSYSNVIILLLLLVVFWFGATIVRLERYRYADQVYLCYDPGKDYVIDFNAAMARQECLNTAKPRTSAIWDLYYALLD